MGGMKKKGPAQRSRKKARSGTQRPRPAKRMDKRSSDAALPCEDDFAGNFDWDR